MPEIYLALASSAAPDAAIATAATALCADGGPPELIQLMPIGALIARDGRRWRLDDLAHAQRVVEASRALAGSGDLVIDYDHQTDIAVPKGGRAEAAGWIKVQGLEARPEGIFARVEWTAEAAAKLAAKAYRYISPVFQYDAAGRVLRILRAGLTNNPALDLLALASAGASPNHGAVMEPWLQELLQALGLPPTADRATALAHAAQLQAAAQTARSATAQVAQIATAAGLAAGATADQVVTAVTSMRTTEPDPTRYVPMATYTAVASQLQTLQGNVAKAAAETAADGAIKAGKLAPAQRDWAIGYASKDPEGFKVFMDAQPVIVQPGAHVPGGKPEDKIPGQLDDADKAICAALGLSPDEYLKTKAA